MDILDLMIPPTPALFILSLTGLITPTIGRIMKNRGNNDLTPYIALSVFTFSLLYFALIPMEGIKTWVWGQMKIDLLGYIFGFIFSLSGLLITAASLESLRNNPNSEAFYGLLLLSVVGSVLIAFSNDLLFLFIAVSLFSIASYNLVAIKKDAYASEAAMKYFLISVLSSALVLYAASIIYGLTGTTSIPEIEKILFNNSSIYKDLISIVFLILIAGIGFEMAIVPFHLWMPDVCEGTAPIVATYIMTISKIAGLAAFIRLLVALSPIFTTSWIPVISFLSVLTMTIGNIAALMQRNMMRLLVYSGIAHVGYIMIGIIFISTPVAIFALSSAVLHAIYYVLMKGGAFLAATSVEKEYGSSDIEIYNGLSKSMPFTAFSLSIVLLALGGIPPLNGFWSKVLLFWAAIQGGYAWIAVAGLLNSAFSIAYYAWIIKRMYLDKPKYTINVKESKIITSTIIIIAILVLITGIFYDPIFNIISKAVSTIYPITSH
ncbi:MAG: NADH-quinone oxidoreductase subunit N [Thermoprotei archaeon]